MLKYSVVKKEDKVGIAAYDGEEQVGIIWDITPETEELKELVSVMNKMEVSLLHFNEIIEDYIQQRAMI